MFSNTVVSGVHYIVVGKDEDDKKIVKEFKKGAKFDHELNLAVKFPGSFISEKKEVIPEKKKVDTIPVDPNLKK